MFMQRPEEPTAWAGLPGEPWEPTDPKTSVDADALPDPVALVDGSGVESVVIPLDLHAWEAAATRDGADDD